MRARVLGGLTIDGIEERELGSRKARTLVKVLVLARGAAVPVDRLADVLWGEDPPTRPADQVGVLASRLRRVLGPERLVRTDAGYRLHVDWLDADELAARAREAADALQRGRMAAARSAAHAALALARGPVLPEEDGHWVEVERVATAGSLATARRVAAEAAFRAGDHLGAVTAAEAALADDPYDESVLRVLMRALVAAGRPGSALAAYVRVRDRLADDLGVSPTAETETLHEAIVLEDVHPPLTDDPPPATLAGRADELARLDQLLARTIEAASPVVAEIVGEAGIGKTTLVERWAARAAQRAFVLVGRCDPLGRDLPLQPIADAVAGELATRDATARAAALGPDAQMLGPLLGVDAGDAAPIGDQDLGRARLFAALRNVVDRLAEDRAPVVVVEDLHLAGASTREWMGFAARRPGRLLLVSTSRPPVVAGSQGDVTRIELGPLDVAATAELVGVDRAEELHRTSGGNPLLLVALSTAGAEGVSTTIADVVERRLDGLGSAATTVRTAAILGVDVDLDLLADVLRLPAVAVLEDLEAASSAGVLVERGAGFAFRHQLEREAIESAAGAARRSLVHRAAARILAARAAPDALVVAVHARAGGDAALAATWFARAAELAAARYDGEAAEEHLDVALALADTAATRTARARIRMERGRLDEAATDAALAVAAGGGVPALEVSGWIAYYRRSSEEALAFADAALERAEEAEVRVSCLALAGRVHHGAGRVHEATRHLETALGEPAGPGVRALAGIWLSQVRAHQGRPDSAVELLDRALVEPERIAHPFAPLHGWFVRAMSLGYLGRAQDALRACDELDAEVARRGEVGARMLAPAANVRAWLLRWTGHAAEADDLNRQALEAPGPSLRGESYYAGLLDLADGRLLAGDDGGAAALLDQLAPIEHWKGTMAWHQRHRWHLLRARVALRDGDRDTAAERCAAVAADAAARGAGRYELLARGVGILAGADDATLPEVVDGLRRVAALDGAPLIEALSRRAR